MKKTIIALVVLIIVGIGAYFLVFNQGSNNLPPSENTANLPPVPVTYPPAANTPAALPGASTPVNVAPSSATVNISNFSFSPGALSVKAGTKVTWTNNDSVGHTITSDSGNLLSSPTLAPGESFSFIFTNPGSVNYHCSIHPMMKGTITVE